MAAPFPPPAIAPIKVPKAAVPPITSADFVPCEPLSLDTEDEATSYVSPATRRLRITSVSEVSPVIRPDDLLSARANTILEPVGATTWVPTI